MQPHRNQLSTFDKFNVTLVRIAPRNLDFDNLYAAMKSIIDAVANVINPGLAPGRADGLDNISFKCDQEHGKIPMLRILISESECLD